MAKRKAPVAHIEGATPAEQEQTARSEQTHAPATEGTDVQAPSPAPAPPSSPAPAPKAAAPRVRVAKAPAAADEPPAASKATRTTTASTGEAAPAGEADSSQRGPLAWVAQTFPGHTNAVLGGVAGLVVALLFFVIGVWQTLFVCALVLVGVAVGQCLDGDPKIVNALRRMIAAGPEDDQS